MSATGDAVAFEPAGDDNKQIQYGLVQFGTWQLSEECSTGAHETSELLVRCYGAGSRFGFEQKLALPVSQQHFTT